LEAGTVRPGHHPSRGWGDLITLREWSQAWLTESFRTYSDYLWTWHEKGEDPFWTGRVAALETLAAVPDDAQLTDLFKTAVGDENSRVRRTGRRRSGPKKRSRGDDEGRWRTIGNPRVGQGAPYRARGRGA
jgi:hypothetical protein